MILLYIFSNYSDRLDRAGLFSNLFDQLILLYYCYFYYYYYFSYHIIIIDI